MKKILRFLTFFLLGLNALHFLRIDAPKKGPLGLFKMLAEALAPYLSALSALGAFSALLARDPWSALAGSASALISARYVWRVTASRADFARAFGPDWQQQVHPVEPGAMLAPRVQRWSSAACCAPRWSWRLPATPEPCWERDRVFARIPGSQRDLLCDLWQPPQGVRRSGVAIVFFHGSGWHFLDKDFGTRPFFRHLAAQGHVIMDVAYRLCPETDFFGMIGDVKRAIAWMKANAAQYGVDPAKIVAMGASAGGHLSLLAAYAPDHPQLTPEDLRGMDLSVKAVVSYYGPTDMRAYHAHAGRTLGYTAVDLPLKPPSRFERTTTLLMKKLARIEMPHITHRQMMQNLMGGQPDEKPAVYALASPINHVSPGCPPTFLIQGEHDQLVPVAATRALYQKLCDTGVPAVYLELPQTEHAFDVAFQSLSQRSPAAQAALYAVDRFLALCE